MRGQIQGTLPIERELKLIHRWSYIHSIFKKFLLHPMVSQFYFSNAYYNLMCYECFTKNVFCCVQGETNGKRRCNEICSVIYKYLISVDRRKKVTEVALYADDSSGQQKNKAMCAATMHFLQQSTNVKMVHLNFLQAGHTMMTADSVHVVIERSVKNWPSIIGNAHFDPFPYNVTR